MKQYYVIAEHNNQNQISYLIFNKKRIAQDYEDIVVGIDNKQYPGIKSYMLDAINDTNSYKNSLYIRRILEQSEFTSNELFASHYTEVLSLKALCKYVKNGEINYDTTVYRK